MSIRSTRRLFLSAAVLLVGCQSIGLPPATPVRDGRGPGVPRNPPPEPVAEKPKDEPAAVPDAPLIALLPVAGELAETVTALSKELTGAPAPGLVHLRDLDAKYEKFDGNPELDVLTALREQKKPGYDFRYVRLGSKSHDEFFQAAAEHYAIAFQTKELDARLRYAAAKLLREPVDSKVDTDELVARAMNDGGFKGREQLEVLAEVDRLNMTTAARAAKRTAKLVDTGKRLTASAPRNLKQPKEVRERIVLCLKQSVALVEGAGALLDVTLRK